jgi:hypothetical protein
MPPDCWHSERSQEGEWNTDALPGQKTGSGAGGRAGAGGSPQPVICIEKVALPIPAAEETLLSGLSLFEGCECVFLFNFLLEVAISTSAQAGSLSCSHLSLEHSLGLVKSQIPPLSLGHSRQGFHVAQVGLQLSL